LEKRHTKSKAMDAKTIVIIIMGMIILYLIMKLFPISFRDKNKKESEDYKSDNKKFLTIAPLQIQINSLQKENETLKLKLTLFEKLGEYSTIMPVYYEVKKLPLTILKSMEKRLNYFYNPSLDKFDAFKIGSHFIDISKIDDKEKRDYLISLLDKVALRVKNERLANLFVEVLVDEVSNNRSEYDSNPEKGRAYKEWFLPLIFNFNNRGNYFCKLVGKNIETICSSGGFDENQKALLKAESVKLYLEHGKRWAKYNALCDN